MITVLTAGIVFEEGNTLGLDAFLCLFFGLFFGLRNLSQKVLKGIDLVINIALVVLMLTIGFHIGTNDSVVSNIPSIGFHCVVISLSAIFFSVVLTVLTEKTLLPLDELKKRLFSENLNISGKSIWKEKRRKKHLP